MVPTVLTVGSSIVVNQQTPITKHITSVATPSNNEADADQFFTAGEGTVTGRVFYESVPGTTNNEIRITSSIGVKGKSLTLLSSVMSNSFNLVSINAEAFKGAEIEGTLTISDGITTIGNQAFMNNASLTGISIPGSVTSIGSVAFTGCSLNSITLDTSNTSLMSIALTNGLAIVPKSDSTSWTDTTYCVGGLAYGALDLSSDTTLTKCPDSMFYGCNMLTAVTFPTRDDFTTIGKNSFYECSGLVSISIPNNITKIDDGAFKSCTNLATVNITEFSGLTNIGDEAFYSTTLTSFVLPKSMVRVGANSFANCNALSEIHILNPSADWTYADWTGIDLGWIPVQQRSNKTIVVPNEGANNYREIHNKDWLKGFKLYDADGNNLIPKDNTNLIVALCIGIPAGICILVFGSLFISRAIRKKKHQKQHPSKSK